MNKTKKTHAAVHTTHHPPFSLLHLASATAKPVKQKLSLTRKQTLELPQATSPRGCGVYDMVLGEV